MNMCCLDSLAETKLCTRTLLLLQDKSKLEEQERWLYDAYKKTVRKIFEKTSNSYSSIDSFAGQYYGKEAIKSTDNYYDSLLEITSYFWGSKGGRGKILQKLFKKFAGSASYEESHLSIFLDNLINDVQDLNGNVSKKFKIKIDLLNTQDKKLTLFEIKNRIDSGGTAARNEGLNKYFDLSNKIVNDIIALTDSNTRHEYTLPELLAKLGITKFEMLTGFLYNIQGGPATLADDKDDGFYTTSKKLVQKYATSNPGLSCDVENLKITMPKNNIEFVIETVYGDDVIKRFTGDKYVLEDMSTSVFKKPWDDMWIALTLGISQRYQFLEFGTNCHMCIRDMYDADSDFKAKMKKIKVNSDDMSLLKEMTYTIQSKIPQLNMKDQDIADCIYISVGIIP